MDIAKPYDHLTFKKQYKEKKVVIYHITTTWT